jgi:hypothetical protein
MTDGKFQFIAALFFIILGAVGHWAFSSLDFGKAREVVINDIDQIDGAAQDISDITDSLADLTQEIEDNNQTGDPVVEEPAVNPHQDVVDKLQKLIDDEIYMKEGSSGTRVGTVQQFLNIFSDTNNNVDNEFGSGTKAKVVAFQKSVSITADGAPGPTTYQSMIDWLLTKTI